MMATQTFRKTYAEIDLDRLVKNTHILKSLVNTNDFFCPMIKGDAYGHGAGPVAHALVRAGYKTFGVNLIEEAVDLREQGILADLLVFGVFWDRESVEIIEHFDLIPVVSSFEQLNALIQFGGGKIRIHLKFETGMNRLGFEPSDFDELLDQLKQSSNLEVCGVATHLSEAENLISQSHEGSSIRQIERFAQVAKRLSEESKKLKIFQHMYNSAGLLLASCKDSPALVKGLSRGARPGIALYQPVQGIVADANVQITPVMSLKTEVVTVRRVTKGETVSYNNKWRASKDSTIAVLGIGYADGVGRLSSDRAFVWIRGKRCPIVGIVCMDFVMVDVSDLNVQVGDTAEIFGRHIRADEHAEWNETISYEVYCRVSKRVPRKYISSSPLA